MTQRLHVELQSSLLCLVHIHLHTHGGHQLPDVDLLLFNRRLTLLLVLPPLLLLLALLHQHPWQFYLLNTTAM
jgi:hypothetical protein